MNRKLMAVIAEISTQQVQLTAYQSEKNRLQEHLKESQTRFEAGLPPNDDALKMWEQYMKRREEKEQSEQEKLAYQNIPKQTAFSTTGFTSTAEARPNMYVPEDDILGIAKPFFVSFLLW